MPAAITESGLYFDPPPEGCFRWQDCHYFVDHFKRFGVHEMDFAWWDPAAQVMNLLELKDYSRPTADQPPKLLVNELVQKATDCLLLLGSAAALTRATHCRMSGGSSSCLPARPSNLERASSIAALAPSIFERCSSDGAGSGHFTPPERGEVQKSARQ